MVVVAGDEIGDDGISGEDKEGPLEPPLIALLRERNDSELLRCIGGVEKGEGLILWLKSMWSTFDEEFHRGLFSV